VENYSGMILTGEDRRKTYPSATLVATNPKGNDLGANLGLHGDRPVTNCLRYGTAIVDDTLSFKFIFHIIYMKI
jgi:hypothetical protein